MSRISKRKTRLAAMRANSSNVQKAEDKSYFLSNSKKDEVNLLKKKYVSIKKAKETSGNTES